ncbi:MAG: bifunctional hydroxymethylpyrimidine kinase/phosphomethylpyrimidine kinase [Oleiphilus sp.]
MNHKKNVLTVAGSDSSGGAGIQADLKTLEALNVYGASVISSITAQNTLGVQAIFDLPTDIFAAQLESVFSDIHFSAVKIGMLKLVPYIELTAESLRRYKPDFVVMDPVMVSSSGKRLMDESALTVAQETLFPYIHLLTPNIPEAATLLSCSTSWVSNNRKQACEKLMQTLDLQSVLLKGGHADSDICVDTLAFKEAGTLSFSAFSRSKINSPNTHGTGCTLSSAIAGYIALGFPLEQAVKLAGEFTHKSILLNDQLQVGQGCGPLNHRGAQQR